MGRPDLSRGNMCKLVLRCSSPIKNDGNIICTLYYKWVYMRDCFFIATYLKFRVSENGHDDNAMESRFGGALCVGQCIWVSGWRGVI